MAETEVVVETVTTILPREEYPILSGPNEKSLMFSAFGNDHTYLPLEFVLWVGGEEHRVKAKLFLAQWDDLRKTEGICYYITGEFQPSLPNAQYCRIFVALYDAHGRRGRWFPVPNSKEYVGLFLPSHRFIKGNIESANAERCSNCGGYLRNVRGTMLCPQCTTAVMPRHLGGSAHKAELPEQLHATIARMLRGGASKVQVRRELNLPDFQAIDAIDFMIHAPDDAE
jgi:hypothetical protein